MTENNQNWYRDQRASRRLARHKGVTQRDIFGRLRLDADGAVLIAVKPTGLP